MGRFIDLTGQRFGRLVVVNKSDVRKRGGSVTWNCLCDCGKTTIVSGNSLRQAATRSCGCVRTAWHKEYGLTHRQIAPVGKRFGFLTVIGDAGKKQNHSYMWMCKCDCGKSLCVSSNHLSNGHTKSCGCIVPTSSRAQMMSIIGDNLMERFDGTTISQIRTPSKIWKNNTSGIRGVCWHGASRSWRATIGFKSHRYELGSYHLKGDAAYARKNAEEQVFGNFVKWYDENIKPTLSRRVNV